MAPDPDVVRALAGEAFTVVDGAGGRVLLPVVVADGTAVVRSEVAPADLHRGVATAWFSIIALGLLLLAASWVIANRLGHRISQPLLGVAGVAHTLRAGDLSARAKVTGTEETRSSPGRSTGWPNAPSSCWPPSGSRSPTSRTGCAPR